jgi:hypothetical protein
MPAIIATIIPIIQGIIKYAPDVVKAAEQVKALIAALFGAKAIDAATQDVLMNHVDVFLAGFEAGRTPPAWQVDEDPTEKTTVTTVTTKTP